MKKGVLVEVCSFLLILLFVYAASSKLFGFEKFHGQLYLYPLVKHFPLLTAISVISAELIISALLLFPATRLWGFAGSAALLVSFTVYLSASILSHKHLPCSCGGVIQYMSWKQHIVFNLGFLVLSLAGGASIINNRSSRKPVESSRQQNQNPTVKLFQA